MRNIKINQQPVELYKILKFESLVSSGGEAKSVIAAGLVRLNGEVETQKRKKIMAGDLIEFAGEQLQVELA
ncbi:MAG: RNA-binding S4 domain-containing protein [Halopseudomonas sp.]